MFIDLLNKIKFNLKANRWSEEFEEVKNLLKTERDFDLALEVLNKILRIESDPEIRVVASLYKSMVLYFLKKYEESLESCNLVLEDSPDLGKALLMIKGDALRHLGRYEEASDIYRKWLEFEPTDIDALMNDGFCLNMLGRYQEAINTLNKVLIIEPCNINAIDNKSFTLNKLGELGNEIGEVNCNDIIKIIKKKLPDSEIYLLGEQKKDETWDMYVIDPRTNEKSLVHGNVAPLFFQKFFDYLMKEIFNN